MNNTRYIPLTLVTGILSLSALPLWSDDDVPQPMPSPSVADSLLTDSALTPTADDGTKLHTIHIQSRAYQDRIVLRWAPSDYVSWRMGLTYGYSVRRIDRQHMEAQDIATSLKPLSEEQFVARFGEQDTVAMAAGELIYGVQPSFDGSLSINQIMEEQEGIYSFAMLVCDMRPDVAEAMGLCFTDRTALPQVEYDYVVTPCMDDSTFLWQATVHDAGRLGDYKPEAYAYAPIDSVKPPLSVQLIWPNIWYSAYDIERREGKDGSWLTVNSKPYMTGNEIFDPDGNRINIYNDVVPAPGSYQYRIAGYDLFGERSEPGPAIDVEVPDMIPPAAPLITMFFIQPGDTLVDIHIRKAELEDDMQTYRAYYYNKELYGEAWLPLEADYPFVPTDTVLTVRVKDLTTGAICVAAVDQSGNEGYSAPMPYHVEDKTPPSVPQHLRARVSPSGIAVVMWSPSPEPDVHYYDLFYANDTTHTPHQMPRPMTRDTIAFDTLDLSAMHQFRYYQVMAVDWAGNESARSPWLQVSRPNFKAPQVCRLDSMWQNDNGLYSRWIPSPEPDIKEYRILRRRNIRVLNPRGEMQYEPWVLIDILPADSVRADGRLYVHDCPRADRQHRYHYCIESVNTTGTASGASLYAHYQWNGPINVDVQLKLEANYREEEKVVQLAWEVKGLKSDYRPGGYYIIYRRLPGQEDFTELVTLSLDEVQYTNLRFPADSRIEYRMRYRNEDLRVGPFSNIVTVVTPLRD